MVKVNRLGAIYNCTCFSCEMVTNWELLGREEMHKRGKNRQKETKEKGSDSHRSKFWMARDNPNSDHTLV